MENDWVSEYSCGYFGYRNRKTREWRYASEVHEMLSEKTIVLIVEDQQSFVDFLKKNYNLSNIVINEIGKIKIEINYTKSQEDLIEAIKHATMGWNARSELIMMA